MDIIHDKFGFMLAFGDLVWVPFTYTLQMQCLYFSALHRHKVESSDPDVMISTNLIPSQRDMLWLALIIVLFLVGYWIFRTSNLQKHYFRFPERHPKMRLKTGRKLRSWRYEMSVNDMDHTTGGVDGVDGLAGNVKDGGVALLDYEIWGEKVDCVETKRGTKLLCSGWWGVARHMNYTGVSVCMSVYVFNLIFLL